MRLVRASPLSDEQVCDGAERFAVVLFLGIHSETNVWMMVEPQDLPDVLQQHLVAHRPIGTWVKLPKDRTEHRLFSNRLSSHHQLRHLVELGFYFFQSLRQKTAVAARHDSPLGFALHEHLPLSQWLEPRCVQREEPIAPALSMDTERPRRRQMLEVLIGDGRTIAVHRRRGCEGAVGAETAVAEN